MSRTAVVSMIVLGFCSLGGCGRGGAPTRSAPAVTLVDAGASPRAPLRLRLAPGVATYEVRQPTAGKSSGIRWGLETRLEARNSGGDFPLSLRMDGFGSYPDAGSMVLGDAQSRLSLTLRGEAQDRGVFVERARESQGEPSGAHERALTRGWQARFALLATRFIFPLPDDPVGVGARWRQPFEVTDRTLFPGSAEMEFSLTATDERGISLHVTLSGAAGEYDRLSLPPGSAVHVLSTAVSGDGDWRIPAGSIVAEGSMTMRETSTEIAKPGEAPTTRVQETSIECRRLP